METIEEIHTHRLEAASVTEFKQLIAEAGLEDYELHLILPSNILKEVQSMTCMQFALWTDINSESS
jgi:hypothetical protein